MQKKAIRIMNGKSSRHSYRQPFKELDLLTLPCEYINSLVTFFVINRNLQIHNMNTRQKDNLHKPVANLTSYQNVLIINVSEYLMLSHKT
ncbi:hypothetical protein C0J52_13010 [Blattella germanica]|nr:hypothetical protein C0J52_13010 [Blattella germanica]